MKRSLLVAAALFVAAHAHAKIADGDAIKALIGEGGNQSDRTLLHLASALRNRGTLQGVYGVSNPVVAQADAKLRARAERAWKLSAAKRTTRCKYFGCAGDASYFARIGYKAVFTSGGITFYKP